MSAQLYIVRDHAAPGGGREIVDRWPRGMDWFPVAVQLWRLVEPARAGRIEDVLADVDRRSEAHGEGRCEANDMRILIDLFDDLQSALVAAKIVDGKMMIRPEQVDELAPKLPGLDFRTSRPAADILHAVAEGIVNVNGLRTYMQRALDEGGYLVTSY
jgi:hypothetical protein